MTRTLKKLIYYINFLIIIFYKIDIFEKKKKISNKYNNNRHVVIIY